MSSPLARNKSAKSAVPGSSTAFVWVVWKGGPPTREDDSLSRNDRHNRRGTNSRALRSKHQQPRRKSLH
jgi:hypothetical protein